MVQVSNGTCFPAVDPEEDRLEQSIRDGFAGTLFKVLGYLSHYSAVVVQDSSGYRKEEARAAWCANYFIFIGSGL